MADAITDHSIGSVLSPAPQFSSSVPAEPQPYSRILRLPEVMERVGLSRASVYTYIAAGNFPKQMSLGPNTVGWLESEIEAWIAQRISTRRGTKA